MLIPRIFISAELKSKQEIILDINSSNHLLRVLRLKINDSLIIFNNSDVEFHANIISIDKNRAVVVFINEFVKCSRESPLQIHLGQGISRGEKMDFTVQKAVELGVNIITPLFTEHCNVKLKDERLENRIRHWQGVAISASEQSGRCFVANILLPQNLKDWLSKATGLRLVLDPYSNTMLSDIKEKPECVTLLIGPEGGLSDREIALAAQKNFLPINLGPRILRTETAGLAAISVLQAKWGDFIHHT